ncbi:uncharacterized protein Z519_12707, partial [Cladophialophora bantiana CBS 173.52]
CRVWVPGQVEWNMENNLSLVSGKMSSPWEANLCWNQPAICRVPAIHRKSVVKAFEFQSTIQQASLSNPGVLRPVQLQDDTNSSLVGHSIRLSPRLVSTTRYLYVENLGT